MTTRAVDPLVLGRWVRHHRKRRGLTLDELGVKVSKPGPYLSQLENGKKEPRLGLINDLAEALDVAAVDLLANDAPTRRDRLEVALVRAQEDPLYLSLGLPHLKPSVALPDAALEHILRLYDELKGRSIPNIVTREEARIANSELRDEMRARGNYFGEIEKVASEVVEAVGYPGTGPISQGDLQSLAGHLGFTVHRAQEVPTSVRSVTDMRNRRVYIPQRDMLTNRAARSVVMQTLGHFALDHGEPADFTEFLRQRVEANYFAGAVLMPEAAVVSHLRRAMDERDVAVEDLKDLFYVSYEMAAHRFTNMAAEHLDLPVHFVRSDEHGIIWKAYETDDVPFPRNSVGAVEGQRLCREWGTRRAFYSDDKYAMHYQYTDTSNGTYWCGTHVDPTREPLNAITVGVRFEHAKYFRGRDTDRRSVSLCPNGLCCRRPPETLAARWDGWAYPSVRPDSHVLAAMPVETIPGVDVTEVYEFLDRHAPS